MDTPLFSRWTAWAERCDIEGCDSPGVYVLARFIAEPPRRVNPIAKEVIYVGETCAQTLTKRWCSFHRSAFEGKAGHSGGETFFKDLFHCDRAGPPVKWLYVAALPVMFEEPRRSAFIRFTERRLIWEYVQKFDCFPECNKK